MATIVAASASRTDVNTAISAASNGDTVTIPSGTATWSTGIAVNKSIIIQGAGSSSTVLTSSTSSGNSLLEITPQNNTDSVQVTGIGFILGTYNGGRQAVLVNGKGVTAFAPSKVRLDHCAVTGGGGNPGAFVTVGLIYGVMDHNTFTNSYSPVFGWGVHYDNEAWADAKTAGGIFAGTANAMFVEDNTFTLNSSLGTGVTSDAQIYLQEGGAAYVVRYNTFDASTLVSPNYINLMYDHHGNQDYYTGGTNFRGIPIFESYHNTATGPANTVFMIMRGGSLLIHDETLICPGSSTQIELWEEEAWQTSFFSPLRTAWPAQDQVNNSFFWNNTINGSPITSVSNGDPADATFLQEDRDYFFHAPQSSGGKESYTGARYGGSTTSPTGSDTGSMTFSSSGANAYYPYTPYTYPHPLVGGGGGGGGGGTGHRHRRGVLIGRRR